MRGPAGLTLLPAVRRSIIQHALRDRPLECCGFLVGSGRAVRFAVSMQNLEASATRYRIDDRMHIELRRLLRGFDPELAIQGVYHSHPAGDAEPSETDIAGALYPEWVHVIVGLVRNPPRIRAFQIEGGCVRAIKLR